jgi:hypothetical protein
MAYNKRVLLNFNIVIFDTKHEANTVGADQLENGGHQEANAQSGYVRCSSQMGALISTGCGTERE